MAVLSSEVIWRKSATVSGASSNGGRMSTAIVGDNVKNGLLPDQTSSQLTAGATHYRKIFIHIASAEDRTFTETKVGVNFLTPGGDRVLIFSGTQTNTQGDLTGSERVYGVGTLYADVSTGGSSVQVDADDAADAIFQDGDLVRIADTDEDNTNGNAQFIQVTTVSWNANRATLTLNGTLDHDFTVAAGTRVSSVIEVGDIEPAVSAFTVNSVAGTYDDTTYPPVPKSIGSVQQDWTLTFTSATTVTIVGDTVGNLGSFNITADIEPIFTALGAPYFRLLVDGWGGTFTTGDTITFTTAPAATPVWCKRVTPAGTAVQTDNYVDLFIQGDA